MRILHTSDWHIGRRLGDFQLDEAQYKFFDHLVATVKSEKIDAVLVSGDIYDRQTPPLEAVEILNYALTKLSENCKVILTSGNHDSSRRLGFASELLERANIFLRTSLKDLTRPIELDNGKKKVLVYGIPYLEPFTVASKLYGEDNAVEGARRSHDLVIKKALNLIKDHKDSQVHDHSIVMSHAWFTGADPDGSELDITIGGLGNVSTKHLSGFDYAALGHIHKPSDLEEHIRYSGSALPYSFGEKNLKKRTIIVDFSGAKPTYEEVLNPVFRELHQLEGSLSEFLNGSKFEKFKESFLKINLTDMPEPPQAMMQLKNGGFPYVVELRTVDAVGVVPDWHQIEDLNEEELCCQFIQEVRKTDVTDWEKGRIQQAILESRKYEEGEVEVELEEQDS